MPQQSKKPRSDKPPSRKKRKRAEQSILWHFESMDRINRAMQGTNDLEQVMKDVLDALLSVFECDRAWLVYPCDPDSPTWQVPMERTRPEYPSQLPIGVELPLDPIGAEIYRILRSTDGPVKFGAGEKYPVPMEIAGAFQVQSFIAMAFYPKIDKPWSFGLHQCSYARVWTSEDERLFQEIGRRISDTLSSLLAYRNLQENEKQIKQLIDVSPVAMVVSSRIEEHVEWVNAKFTELFGYTMEDIPDVAHWWPLAYPDEKYREEIRAMWTTRAGQAIRNKSEIEPVEATVRCKDGSYRYIEIRLSSIGQKHLVTFVDLTERKRAEHALYERERHSQSLLRFSQNLERAQTYAEVLRAALNEVKSILGYQNLWVYLFTEDKKHAHALIAQGEESELALREEIPVLTIQGDRMLEEIAEATHIVVVEDARTDERTNKELVQSLGVITIVNIPIILFDRHLGSVGTGTFGDEGLRVPTLPEQEYLSGMASHMAVTLDRIRLLTERKQAEEALREAEVLYRRAIESAGTIPYYLDRTTMTYRFLGEGILSLTGYSVDETTPKLWSLLEQETVLIGEAAGLDFQEAARRAENGEIAVWKRDILIRARDGQMRWVADSSVQVFNEQGKAVASIGILQDITERKHAEKMLRESEEKYRTLIQKIQAAVVVHGAETQILTSNSMAQELLGLTEDEMRGKTAIDSAWHFFLEDGTPIPIEKYPVNQVLASRKPLRNFTARVHRPTKENDVFVLVNADPVFGKEDEIIQVIVTFIDITEQKQAEEALRESEWRYREVFDNVLDSLFLLEVTKDGRFRNLEMNPAIEKSTGIPRAHMIGKFIEEVVPEDTASIVNSKYRRCVEAGYPIEEEVELDLPAGRRYFHSTLIPARDETDRVHRIIGISRDITERKRAEMALSRERELLRTLVDNLPEEIYVKDRERRFLFVNELLVRALGAQSMDEVIGKRDEDFWPPYLAKQFADEENELMQTGKPLLNDEHSPPHKSGPKRWLLRTKLPLRDGAGNIIGLAGLGSDITERKQAEQAVRESEERLRQIASSLREVVWLRDAKTRQVLYVNPAFQELTGRTCESFYENRDLLRDAIHPDDRKEVTKALEKRSQSVPFENEHRIIHLNGSVRWVSSKSFAVRNEAGEVYRWASVMEDITERKLAAEALRESERRLVAAQRMAHVGYWERDFDSNHVTLSDEACRIFGIAKQGLSLHLNEWHPRWVALIHPEDQPRLIELLGDVLAGIRSYDVEYRVIRPDGTVRFIYSQAEVKRDASGHAHNMLGMMQDITERKQAELALRASENRFRVLSENAFVGIYIIQDGRLNYCNSTQAKIFGYTPEELIGVDPMILVHPDDQAMVLENIRRRIDGEIETIHYEFRGRCKDGSTKNIEVLGGRIDFSGKTAVIGNLMDITDRKRAADEIERSLAAEKKARQVAEILREATESLSRTLHLEEILQKLLEYLLQLIPYDSANVMLLEGDFHLRVVALRGYERWTDPDTARKLVFDIREIPSLHELVTTKKSVQIANTYEYPGWARVAGTEHIVSWLGIPIITDGQVIGLYSVDKVEPAFFSVEDRLLAEGLAAQAAVAIQNRRLHDQITRANVELEQRVADRTAQLEEANRELEAFAYSVSHDLRAPLRHIDGFIELLQKRTKTNMDDKSQHYMEMISDSAQKMGMLIDDLLSFSRMGRQEIYTSQVDLNDLIQDIMRESETETRGRNIQWEISRLPLVTGDRAMLRIVLANLIANAVKFTRPTDFAEIEIGYEANDSEITLYVRDNGVGFDMKYADKLFGVFQRLHSQEDFEGTGIGLANVHRIIQRHGGRTWAEGQVDNGSTFYFSLPITN